MKISTRVEIGSHDMNATVVVSQFLMEFFKQFAVNIFCECNAKITSPWLET